MTPLRVVGALGRSPPRLPPLPGARRAVSARPGYRCARSLTSGSEGCLGGTGCASVRAGGGLRFLRGSFTRGYVWPQL